MNKLALYPLAIMFIFAIATVGNNAYVASSGDIVTPGGSVFVDGEQHNITMPGAEKVGNVNMWVAADLMLLLVAACAVAIAMGFQALGSGFSTLSQRIFYNLTMYGGIWGMLSLVTIDALMVKELAGIGVIVYVGLTVSYVMGFMQIGYGSD